MIGRFFDSARCRHSDNPSTWHHDVEQDEVGRLLAQRGVRFGGIFRLAHHETLADQIVRQRLAQAGFVIESRIFNGPGFAHSARPGVQASTITLLSPAVTGGSPAGEIDRPIISRMHLLDL